MSVRKETASKVNTLGNSWNAANLADRDVQVEKKVKTEFMTR